MRSGVGGPHERGVYLDLAGVGAVRAEPPGFQGPIDSRAVHAGRCGGFAQPYCHGIFAPMRAGAWRPCRNLAPLWFPFG